MSIKNDRKKRDIGKIIDRLCVVAGVDNPSQLSKYLGLKPNSVTSWKAQETVPYEYIDVLSEKSNKPFEWFLDGIEAEKPLVADSTERFEDGVKLSDEQKEVIGLWMDIDKADRPAIRLVLERFAGRK